jgi:hypothetical protein
VCDDLIRLSQAVTNQYMQISQQAPKDGMTNGNNNVIKRQKCKAPLIYKLQSHESSKTFVNRRIDIDSNEFSILWYKSFPELLRTVLSNLVCFINNSIALHYLASKRSTSSSRYSMCLFYIPSDFIFEVGPPF